MKLLVTEEGWALADDLWEGASDLFTCRLTSVETRAALARAHRMGRLSEPELARSRADLAERWEKLWVVELDERLAEAAGTVAETYRLTALDSVHLASALELGHSDLVLASWDVELRRAALEAGLAVAPPS